MAEAPNQGSLPPALDRVYIEALRGHALALVWSGYQRMNTIGFSVADEDEITGELVRHMDEVTQDENEPPWVQFYTVSEQVRSHSPGKLGKKRPIVDVQLERHKRGSRPRLRFEAKRLGRGVGVSGYVGEEGLGAFLDGYYTRNHNDAGMLGYVQSRSEDRWAKDLAAELSSTSHGITKDGAWRPISLAGAPPYTYQTVHLDNENVRLFLFHVLLRFCQS
jgi:hypothetical protein